jgi:hypothetical protein
MRTPVTLAICMSFSLSMACSCFGPQTFCGTLNPQPPQFPEPQWWVPSDIVRVVKLNSIQYGVTVRIVDSFHGSLLAGQEVRVWGDCGLLCRHYIDGVANGDTLLWALQHCDQSGNGSCGTSLESKGDYQLSVCGVYWLGYSDGTVSGPLFTEGATETVSLEEFQALVNGCLPTAVQEHNETLPLQLREDATGPVITMAMPGNFGLRLLDVAGRSVVERSWNGSPFALGDLPCGTFIIQVSSDRGITSRKVLVRGSSR